MNITNLQINHLTDPVGISGTGLRVSWTLEGGKKQTAFSVRVRDEQGNELECVRELTSEMGYTLKQEIPNRTKAVVTVTVWDEEERESAPEEMTVITGIGQDEWTAKWINPEPEEYSVEERRAGYLKKTFTLTEAQVEKAEAAGAYVYATCHGIMNIEINGKEITDIQFMPGTQQYDRRLMVETLPVSEFLKEGENEIQVSIGDGWYRGSMGFSQNKNVYGTDIALLLQLEIGGEPVLVTDETWLASEEGPIGRNDFMAGEEYDAGKEDIRPESFHAVSVCDFGYANLIPVDTVPVLPHETFRAQLVETPNGDVVLDFGQNLVGYVSFEFEGTAGCELTLIHGEVLDADGNFTIANFQNPAVPTKQEIHYICKDGLNCYHPTKTYMGFRYVKVVSDCKVDPDWFRAVSVYSDMRTTASFTCGVPEVNQLFENSIWSMKGNFVDVPTDCPTREKSGYSGDCQAYVHTAMYLMDCYSVYAKWIREQAAGQYEDGVVPQVSPKPTAPGVKDLIGGVLTPDGGIGWSDSFEIVPYRLMKRYGDVSLVKENYEAMKRWTAHEIERAERTRECNLELLPEEHRRYMIDTDWMWGEWLEPEQDDATYMRDMAMKGDPEVGTAFYYMNLVYMAQMAESVGASEDRAYYLELAEKVKAAYRAVFLEDGAVKEQKRQCRLVRPIAHDLLSEEEKVRAAARLSEMISANGDHLNTGFLTTHELTRALSHYGQNRKAYDLLLQKEKPGWLYAVSKGCTTIPESWNCYTDDGTPQASFNHYSYGAISGWLLDTVCGIQVEDGKIRIQPYPDERLGHAEAVYDSPYGTIRSGWKYQGTEISYRIEIPANMEAELCIPGLEPVTVPAGSYEYTVKG